MDSMPPTGQCGFDLYASTPGGLRFAGVTRFGRDATEYAAVLLTPDDERPDVLRGYTLNFPLYQGVREVQIGLTPGAAVEAPEPWALPGPIVAYGTSITQGGCASRPGMAWTNILSRRLNADVINLGFSGNGKGDRPVAEAMREIPSPVLFILDYETNTTMAELRATMPVFVDCLRERHPRIPILVVSKLAYPVERFHPCHIARRTQGREFLEALVADRKRAGDHRLFFLDGATLTGPEDHEWTVDGVHPTDVGFVQIAAGMERKVRAVLGGPSATA
jgi:lysophospholipase L1-like esterase